MISKKRIAVVDSEKCNYKKCSSECISSCPINRSGAECIILGDRKKVVGGLDKIAVIDENLCTGCGICVKRCPYEAIQIVNLPGELEEPTHQYGKNTFRLYGFPMPMKGVVGLVGANGIGKTTILNILTGNIIPNQGNFEEKATWEKTIKKYNGTELQGYLKKIASKEIKLSYKPQDVSKIPLMFKGTVKELIEQMGEYKEDLIEKLEIKNIINQKVSEISGGELQRTAIYITLSKEADFYFFDEPSSYLDVKQRLKIARIIKKLGEEKKVFVVEHDLGVLDYLADYVHILYGKPGVYGVISNLKNARSGINEFLKGYLKEENIRIRNYEIKFEIKPPSSEWDSKKEISYPEFNKTFKNFKLEVKKGKLRKGEVVGILGANGIGKTTYMKILAGEEKADEGKIDLNLKIAYKPQYLDYEKIELTVDEFIKKQDINFGLFNSEFKRVIEDLLGKKVNKLSGGEAQRVAISIALAKESEIILLDEPSAFLDIEQRFLLSQLIKRITEKNKTITMVIDHDILFQDLVSNRLMVFDGVPAVKGTAFSPTSVHEGMNFFLKKMDITFRREPDSGRPRMNKPNSQKDNEQKQKGEYYYML